VPVKVRLSVERERERERERAVRIGTIGPRFDAPLSSYS
jgi:hypothetical protein